MTAAGAVVVTGGTGFIGSALVDALRRDGRPVLVLSRTAAGEGCIQWDPQARRLDPAPLEGAAAVVNLAGSGIGARRWSAPERERIKGSRTAATALLSTVLAGLAQPPPVLVSASAVGYYGDRGEEVLTEASEPGEGFLPEVCIAWEAAADAARQAGIRVCHPRIGLVIGRGGALGKMLPLFRMGLGGTMGSGRQWWSWVSIQDVVGAVRLMIEDERLKGPVNLVGPAALRNEEFTRELAGVLKRPAILPAPELALKAVFGRMAEETLLASQRVEPARLNEAAYEFRHPTLAQALRENLDVNPASS